ncbi:MAG: hypothetical protein JSU68_01445 [Phycisphaerales bacterium]|nr:MAG: hypothetical protein JSU68_01445 [Phycisphaerales bacterium]
MRRCIEVVYCQQMVVIGVFEDAPRKMKKFIKRRMWEFLKFVWHKRMLRKHFRPGAAREYRYKPRRRGYVEEKREEKGHAVPLVWGGATRREATGHVLVTGTSQQATVRLAVPWYVAKKPKKAHAPKLPREIFAVSSRDLSAAAKWLSEKVAEDMNNDRSRKTIRI